MDDLFRYLEPQAPDRSGVPLGTHGSLVVRKQQYSSSPEDQTKVRSGDGAENRRGGDG